MCEREIERERERDQICHHVVQSITKGTADCFCLMEQLRCISEQSMTGGEGVYHLPAGFFQYHMSH